MVATSYLPFAEYGSLKSAADVIPAPITPGHLDTLFGGKVGLAMLPIGVIELRSVGPVKVVEVHLATAKPNLGSIFNVHAREKL